MGYTREIGAKGTLKKSCLPPRWRLLMAHIMQCLDGKTGGLDQISNKNVTILYCLANGVQVDYAKIIWDDLIHNLNKKSREKIVPYPRFISLLLERMAPEYENEELTINPTQVFNVHNLTLNLNQPKEPPFTDHMKAIYNLVVPVDSKASKLSHKLRRFSKAKSLELQLDSEAKDLQNTHLSPKRRHPNPKLANPTFKPSPVRPRIKAQAILHLPRLCFFHLHSESASRHDVLADSTAEADPEPSASNDFIPSQQGMDEGTKNTLYDYIFAGSNPNVLVDKTKSARDGLKTVNTESGASTELGADEISKKIKLEDLADLLKDTRSAFFTHKSPPDEPINVSDESDQKEVKKAKETPATSQDVPEDTSVVELKNIQWEFLAEFLDLPHLASSIQEKLKTLDSLLGLLKTVTNTLNKFCTLMEIASGATTTGVPSVDKATISPAEREKDADTNLENELVDLLGTDIVT
uniref:Uncharacterized protein n=1 Tax=Tanacetum cinerariifolium TaxID=118510 RepID=A0A6L2LPX6_TANCI|nr:hypothetical protein [Tanacetum cinerariifolium]